MVIFHRDPSFIVYTPLCPLSNFKYSSLGCGGWVFFNSAASHVCVLRYTQTHAAASATIHIRIAPPPPRCRCSAHADDNLHGSSRLILMRADECDTCRVSYMGRMRHSPCSRYRLHTPSFAIATFTALGLYIILCIARLYDVRTARGNR